MRHLFKALLFSFLLTVSSTINCLSAQTELKKYDGNYTLLNKDGRGAYYYYPSQDGSRIFHGEFMFASSDNELKAKGRFKNNYQTGTWIWVGSGRDNYRIEINFDDNQFQYQYGNSLKMRGVFESTNIYISHLNTSPCFTYPYEFEYKNKNTCITGSFMMGTSSPGTGGAGVSVACLPKGEWKLTNFEGISGEIKVGFKIVEWPGAITYEIEYATYTDYQTGNEVKLNTSQLNKLKDEIYKMKGIANFIFQERFLRSSKPKAQGLLQ